MAGQCHVDKRSHDSHMILHLHRGRVTMSLILQSHALSPHVAWLLPLWWCNQPNAQACQQLACHLQLFGGCLHKLHSSGVVRFSKHYSLYARWRRVQVLTIGNSTLQTVIWLAARHGLCQNKNHAPRCFLQLYPSHYNSLYC